METKHPNKKGYFKSLFIYSDCLEYECIIFIQLSWLLWFRNIDLTALKYFHILSACGLSWLCAFSFSLILLYFFCILLFLSFLFFLLCQKTFLSLESLKSFILDWEGHISSLFILIDWLQEGSLGVELGFQDISHYFDFKWHGFPIAWCMSPILTKNQTFLFLDCNHINFSSFWLPILTLFCPLWLFIANSLFFLFSEGNQAFKSCQFKCLLLVEFKVLLSRLMTHYWKHHLLLLFLGQLYLLIGEVAC